MNDVLWKVAVDVPLPTPLTYRSSKDLSLEEGDPVWVPLGKRRKKTKAVLLEKIPESNRPQENFEIREILEKDLQRNPLPVAWRNWALWLAEYYQHPIGPVLQMFHPPLGPAKSGRKSRKLPLWGLSKD
ncbi:MAG: hypothetical protein WCH11_03440, partial [Bdellovibrio sp.]